MTRSVCGAVLAAVLCGCTDRALFNADESRPDLAGIDLAGADLTAVDLAAADLRSDDLAGIGDLSRTFDFAGLGTIPANVGGAMPVPQPQRRGAKVGPALWLLAGDLNLDGRADLITIEQNSTVRVYLGDGKGDLFPGQSFQLNTHTELTMGVLADVDGDGWKDLVLSEPGRSDVDVHRANPGGETFGDWVRLQAMGTVQSAAVGDLDGDAVQDLVAVTRDDLLHVFWGQKGSTPVPTVPTFAVGLGVQEVALTDVDGDGHLDAVAVDRDGATISVLRGDGALGFQPATTIAVPPLSSQLVLGDWNGDGRVDVAASGASDGELLVGVLLDQSGALAALPPPLAPGLSAMSGYGGLAGGDMTGDGHADIVVGSDASSLISVISVGVNGAVSTTYPTLDEPALSIALADFDGDGYLDVAAAGPTKTQLYLTSP